MNPVQPHIPEGYLRDAAGRLVPVDTIDEIDIARHDLVLEIVAKAQALKEAMESFKLSTLGDIGAFVDLSAERYGVSLGGKKGNVTLTSFDGRFKVQRAIAEHISFDERLQVAKELIDRCIHRWAEGSAAEIRALVEHAFQVDKEGRISTSRVLSLRRLNIDDAEWKEAMDAIADSIQITGSKTYIRLYKRVGDSDSWQPIALDIAAV
jgi:hypothetical protein